MGALSDVVKNSLLDALCRNTSYQNAAVWAKLHTGAPGSAGTSNAATEATRKQVTCGNAASARAIANTVAIEWVSVSTTETITHVSFWTASTNGTFLGSDALASSRALIAGDNLRIAVGEIGAGVGGAQLSDGIANSMLDAVFRNTAFVVAAVYAKLHLGDPGSAGTSNAAAHTTRVQVTFGAGAASGAISSTAATSFTSLTAAETITDVSLWSASSGGTFLGRDAASSSATVAIGDTYELPTGDVDITLSGTVP